MSENKRLLKYVAEAISQDYNKTFEEAYCIVKNSFLVELLKEDQEFVMHYDAFYWAKEIMQ